MADTQEEYNMNAGSRIGQVIDENEAKRLVAPTMSMALGVVRSIVDSISNRLEREQKHAIDRLRFGGKCYECDLPIEAELLKENPYTRHCQKHLKGEDLVVAGLLAACDDYDKAHKRLTELISNREDVGRSGMHVACADTIRDNDQVVAEGRERTCRKTVEQFISALQRIEDGEYGYCLNPMCEDGEIPSSRLKLAPHALYCLDCQKLMEEREKALRLAQQPKRAAGF